MLVGLSASILYQNSLPSSSEYLNAEKLHVCSCGGTSRELVKASRITISFSYVVNRFNQSSSFFISGLASPTSIIHGQLLTGRS